MWEQAKALQEGAEIVVCTPVSTCLHTRKYLYAYSTHFVACLKLRQIFHVIGDAEFVL